MAAPDRCIHCGADLGARPRSSACAACEASGATRDEGTQQFGPAAAREARAAAASALARDDADSDRPEPTRQFSAPTNARAPRLLTPLARPRVAKVSSAPRVAPARPGPVSARVGDHHHDDDDSEREVGVRRFVSPTTASQERTRLVRALLQNAFVEQSLRRVCARLGSTPEGRSVVIDLGTLVATADGRLDEAEMEILREACCTLLGDRLHAAVVQGLVASSRADIARLGAGERATAVGRALAESGVAEEGLTFALAVGYASNGLSSPEQAVMDNVARAASVSPERLEVLTRRVRDVAEHDWSVPPR